jgi:hypothetical protein
VRTILLTRAVSYEERAFDVVDLVLAGLLSGTWQELERESAAGVAAEEELDAQEAGPPHEALLEAGRTYRYERDLLARDDLERWLDARGLSVADWHGYLRRALARGLVASPGSGDATPVLRADALCSGTLLACARRAIAGAAATRALDHGAVEAEEDAAAALVQAARATAASGLETVEDAELERRARLAAGLERAQLLLADEVAGAEAVESRVAARALEWLSFETEELELASDDAAREARLCVQEDGASLAEVAAAAGGAAAGRTRVFADTPDELRARLVAARPGELVGPVALDGRHLVARLLAKEQPSAHDPTMVERARAELVAEAVDRHTAGRVTWHVAL